MKKSGILLIIAMIAAAGAYCQVPDKVISNLAFMAGTWKTETDW